MKPTLLLAAILWATSPLLAAPTNASSDFTLSSPSRIPGATLDPGSYNISVINQLSDRVILRIDGKGNPTHSLFIGIRNGQIPKPASQGAVRWSGASSGPNYLKGWYFSGGSVIEFVYPKAEALAIASSNPAKVPAVDPASEGKATDNTLSQDDLRVLNLWLLSVNEVSGDSKPAVKAEHYQPAAFSTTRQKSVVSTLPHTASLLPLLWLLGIGSMLAAGSLRIVSRWRYAGAVRISNDGSAYAAPLTR